MDDAELAPVVSLCSRAIYNWAGAKGFGVPDLTSHLPTFANLPDAAKFRVCVLLARSAFIAADAEWGAWRFWALHRAPEHAFRAVERAAKVLP